MTLPRREFLQLAAAAAALPSMSRIAKAQTYPTRPVHLIEGFGAGGAPDIVARLISQWLSKRLGQPFVVENRAGASSNIATEAVVRASPDGYTLLLVTVQHALNTTMLKLNFDFVRDIRPVREHHPCALCHGGAPIGSGQDRRGIHQADGTLESSRAVHVRAGTAFILTRSLRQKCKACPTCSYPGS